jgi:REP element-mobilizing transposase RayT
MDRLLDEARIGPFYLAQSVVADMILDAFEYNSRTLEHYDLHAFVIMPNHVHLLVTPFVPLPKLTKSLKGITAKRGNALLGLIGHPFWQEESYDRMVRDQREFERIRNYIEENPVRAGLATLAHEFRWSSAGSTREQPDQGSGADGGVRPTTRTAATDDTAHYDSTPAHSPQGSHSRYTWPEPS